MRKNIALFSILVLVACLALATSPMACGANPSCAKTCSKSCVTKVSTSGTGCPHGKAGDDKMAAMDKNFEALKADLAQMDKTMTPDEEAAFLKTHKANLQKVMDCKAGHDKAAVGQKAEKDKACCAHMKTMETSMKALQGDMAKMDKTMTPDETSAFMKSHKENLAKFLAAHDECAKECKAHKADKA